MLKLSSLYFAMVSLSCTYSLRLLLIFHKVILFSYGKDDTTRHITCSAVICLLAILNDQRIQFQSLLISAKSGQNDNSRLNDTILGL